MQEEISNKLDIIIELLDTILWQVTDKNLTTYQEILDKFDESLIQIIKENK